MYKNKNTRKINHDEFRAIATYPNAKVLSDLRSRYFGRACANTRAKLRFNSKYKNTWTYDSRLTTHDSIPLLKKIKIIPYPNWINGSYS